MTMAIRNKDLPKYKRKMLVKKSVNALFSIVVLSLSGLILAHSILG